MTLSPNFVAFQQTLAVRPGWATAGHTLLHPNYDTRAWRTVGIWRILEGRMLIRGENGYEAEAGVGEGYLVSPWHPAQLRVVSEAPVRIQGGELVAEVLGGVPLFSMIDLPLHFSRKPLFSIMRFLIEIAACRQLPAQNLCEITALQHTALEATQALLNLGAMRPEAPETLERMRRLSPAIGRMRAQVASPIPVGELAVACGLSASRFYELFVATYGQPPARYRRTMRLEAVRSRLHTSNDTLETLAGEFGFADAFHLSRLFKAHFGQPPSRFR